ncbi:hypothetical protein [Streptomyces spectabilis]|nr:hypothetical protein [Streptomyces spectabilis]
MSTPVVHSIHVHPLKAAGGHARREAATEPGLAGDVDEHGSTARGGA